MKILPPNDMCPQTLSQEEWISTGMLSKWLAEARARSELVRSGQAGLSVARKDSVLDVGRVAKSVVASSPGERHSPNRRLQRPRGSRHKPDYRHRGLCATERRDRVRPGRAAAADQRPCNHRDRPSLTLRSVKLGCPAARSCHVALGAARLRQDPSAQARWMGDPLSARRADAS